MTVTLSGITLLIAVLCASAQNPGVGVVAGTITDVVSHAPVPGARVTLLVDGKSRTVFSGDSGDYYFDGVTGGRAIISSIDKPGYGSLGPMFGNPTPYNVSPGKDNRRDFALPPASRIVGQVVDAETKSALPGFSVVLLHLDLSDGTRRYSPMRVVSQSGDHPSFEFGGLLAGDYWLAADPPLGAVVLPEPVQKPAAQFGYSRIYASNSWSIDAAAPISVGMGETRHVEIDAKKRPLFRIAGTVETRPGGAGPVWISLEHEGRGIYQTIAKGTFKNAGSFVINNVPPDDYQLVAGNAMSDGNLLGKIAVHVSDRDIGNLKLFMDHGVSLKGKVLAPEPQGAIPPNLRITLLPDAPVHVGDTLVAQVSESGEYRFTSISPGTYSVFLEGLPEELRVLRTLYKGLDYTGGKIDVDADSAATQLDWTLTARLGSVAGYVRDDNQAGVGGVVVGIVPNPLPTNFDPRRLLTVTTSPAGWFSTSGLPQGDYALFVFSSDELKLSSDVSILNRKSAAGTKITVLPGGPTSVSLSP